MSYKRRTKYARASTLGKRVRRLEARQAARKPEMKNNNGLAQNLVQSSGSLGYTDMANVDQGTGQNQRIAQKIKIWRVEIRGYMESGLDAYVLQGHSNDIPTISLFQRYAGGHLVGKATNTQFTEWAHWQVYGAGTTTSTGTYGNFKKVIKFPRGYTVAYSDTDGTTATRNRLFLCFKNDTGEIQVHSVCYKIWFTDC